MTDRLWLRNGSWPFQRLTPLNTAGALARSYGLMIEGQAVFTLAQGDAAITDVQRGRMVEVISSEGVEPWVGFVDRLRHEPQQGTVRVECVDVTAKLAERHSGVRASRSGAAGLIARDLLFQANARNAFGLVWDTDSEAGEPVDEIDVGGSSLFDALNQLADVTGQEWWVRIESAADIMEMLLHWGHCRGFNRSQTVVLREGREISEVSYEQDAAQQYESVMVVGGGGSVEDRPTVIRTTANPERVAEPGAIVQAGTEPHRRATPLPPALAAERVVIDPRQTDESVLASRAKRELEVPAETKEMLRLTVNGRADWSLLGVGDTVRAKLESTPWGSLDRPIRIMEAQPDIGELLLEVQVLDD